MIKNFLKKIYYKTSKTKLERKTLQKIDLFKEAEFTDKRS